MASSATRWVRWWSTKVKAHVLGLWGSPSARGNRACKRRKASSVTRHGRHRSSPALHVTRKTRSRRLAVAPLHHGAPRLHHGAPRCDGCFTRDKRCESENENVMAIGETADTIGQGDLGPLTDARTAGPCKMVSANHTGATKR